MPIISTGTVSDFVPPEGDLKRKIVLIGEAPGRDEVMAKRPFVGPAGTILSQCMQHAGVIRQECYITNLFKRPVTKSAGKYKIDGEVVYVDGKGLTDAGKVWRDQLMQELQGSQANVFVPMGEAAIHALTGMFKPTKIRGSVFAVEIGGRLCKVIPCIHPAAAIERKRTEDEPGGAYLRRWFIIWDLRRAKRESADREFHYPHPNILIQPTYQQAMEKLEWIHKNLKRISVDIEVYNQEISCLGIGTKDDVLVVPFTYGKDDYWSLEEEANIWLAIARILEDPSIGKVFQNGLFDTWVLMRNNHIIVRGRLDDTMVAWKQSYPDDGFKKDLATIASVCTDWPYYKDELKIWTTRQLTANTRGDMTQLWTYNAKDVAATDEALDVLLEVVEKQGNMDTYRKTLELYPVLLYMMMRGIHADQEQLLKVKEEITERIAELQGELNKLAGGELNPNSPTQLRNYFYVKKGIKPYTNPKTKGITVDDNALKKMSKATTTRPAIREAQIIREIRSLRKLKGNYLDIEFDKDSRLRCSINPVGTKNGRLSTSQTLFGTGTNMQNLPQQFKRFLKADPGHALIELDKAQGEWVMVAFLSGDAAMMSVVKSGEDAHIATGHMAFRVPKELIYKENKAIGNETDPIRLKQLREELVPEILKYEIPGVMVVRQAGKKSNHGLNYDMGYRLFATVNEVPEAEAKRIVEAYHRGYPGVRQWHRWIQNELQKSRTLVNLFGRKRRFYAQWGDSMFKDGYAFQPQSSLVDLVNRAMIEMYHDKSRYMKPTDYLMQVHDSVLFQWLLANERFNRLARAIWKMKKHMEPLLSWQGRQFIVDTDMKMGLNWAAYNAQRNPIGMKELKIDQNFGYFEDQLAQTWRLLKQNEANM